MGVNTFRDVRQRLIDKIQTLKLECNGVNPPRYEGMNDPYARYLSIDIEEKKLDFDFGGYIPGEDYLPKRSRWRPLAALISVITIGSLLFWSFVVLF